MGSCIGMAIRLAIVAGAAADFEHTKSVPASDASIAVVFACAFTSMQPIYPAEVLPSTSSKTCVEGAKPEFATDDQRAKGMAIYCLTGGCASFVNTFAASIALQNITYWL